MQVNFAYIENKHIKLIFELQSLTYALGTNSTFQDGKKFSLSI